MPDVVRIRLFASLRDAARDQACLEMDLDKRMTAAEIYEKLSESYPDLKRYLPVVQVAVNKEYTGWDATVGPGDEVAFFPPVSGGGYTPRTDS